MHRLIALPVSGARQLPQAATGAQRLAQLSQAPNGTVLGRLHETAPRGFGGPPKLAAAGPRLSRGQAASSPPARCVEYVPTAPPEPSDTVTVASPNALAAKQRSVAAGARTHARTGPVDWLDQRGMMAHARVRSSTTSLEIQCRSDPATSGSTAFGSHHRS